jgi:hypothetical protein
MMTPELEPLINLVAQFGLGAIFLWLYIQKEKELRDYRKESDEKYNDTVEKHMSDLRYLSGMDARSWGTSNNVDKYRRLPDTRPLPPLPNHPAVEE